MFCTRVLIYSEDDSKEETSDSEESVGTRNSPPPLHPPLQIQIQIQRRILVSDPASSLLSFSSSSKRFSFPIFLRPIPSRFPKKTKTKTKMKIRRLFSPTLGSRRRGTE